MHANAPDWAAVLTLVFALPCPCHVLHDKHYGDDLKLRDQGGRSKQRSTAVDIALLFDIGGSVLDDAIFPVALGHWRMVEKERRSRRC
jgi:hypothetical protein